MVQCKNLITIDEAVMPKIIEKDQDSRSVTTIFETPSEMLDRGELSKEVLFSFNDASSGGVSLAQKCLIEAPESFQVRCKTQNAPL